MGAIKFSHIEPGFEFHRVARFASDQFFDLELLVGVNSKQRRGLIGRKSTESNAYPAREAE